MLTGAPPYDDSTIREELEKTEKLPERLRLYRTLMERAKPLSAHRNVEGMDNHLAAIIERCLAVDPSKRYATAEAVVAGLELRDRNRRQKPILYAGLAVPLLLLIILGTLGWWRTSIALDASRTSLEEQGKRSYLVGARLAAVQIERKMNALMKNLTDSAHEPDLAKVLQKDPKAPAAKAPIHDLLKKFAQSIPMKPNPVAIYSLFDDKGHLVGIYPPQDNLLYKNYSWRGYFNGIGDDWPAYEARLDSSGANPSPKTYQSVGRTHISHPYKSVDANQFELVGLSTPVTGDDGNVVGVLVANLNLRDFNEWLDAIQIPGGFAVMIDQQFHLLRHQSQVAVNPGAGKNPKMHDSCDLYRDVFNSPGVVGDSGGPFKDPVLDENYLAGYVPIDFRDPVRGTKVRSWAVLVQVKHATVIEPAVTLKAEMVRWGGMMLVVALLLIVSMWLGLVWMLRREERLAHG